MRHNYIGGLRKTRRERKIEERESGLVREWGGEREKEREGERARARERGKRERREREREREDVRERETT